MTSRVADDLCALRASAVIMQRSNMRELRLQIIMGALALRPNLHAQVRLADSIRPQERHTIFNITALDLPERNSSSVSVSRPIYCHRECALHQYTLSF